MPLSMEVTSVGPLDVNCYLLGCDECGVAVAVDPGDAADRIAGIAERRGWKIEKIVNTHAHADHTGGIARLKELTGAPFWLHRDEVAILTDPSMEDMAAFLGIAVPPAPDRLLDHGDTVELCGCRSAGVIHTPGHTPGGICLLCDNHLISGDTLFRMSVGRTDLLGGDHAALMTSLRERLLPLPDATVVHPGHNDPTTIGDERRYNPFLVSLRAGE